MTPADKKQLAAALLERVTQELSTLRESQKAAQEGAIHEETRQEDPKDTRAIEAQYVSRGLAERVEDLQRNVAALKHLRLDSFDDETGIDVSAIVGLKDGEEERVYFVVPVAGGEKLEHNGQLIQTLTPVSPLGQELVGKCVDDDIELTIANRQMTAVIDWVC